MRHVLREMYFALWGAWGLYTLAALGHAVRAVYDVAVGGAS